MSNIIRIRPLAILVTALAVFTLALTLNPPSAARAATTAVTYTLASVNASPTSPCDVAPCQILSYTVTGTGTTTTPGAPAAQSFTWTLIPSKYASSNACALTQGTGAVSIIWQDLSTTDVTFSFKAHDAHSWVIKGQVTGSTNAAFPAGPNAPASGVVGFPPNPCTGGTVSASISLVPASPI